MSDGGARRSPSVTADVYAALLRRRAVTVTVGVLIGLVAAVGYLAVTPALYRATAEVLVLPLTTDVRASAGGTVVNLDNAAQIVTSAEVVDAVARILGTTDVAGLPEAVEVTVPPNTTILSISFRAPGREEAANGARAFAAAYLHQRREEAAALLAAESKALQASHDDLMTELAQATTGSTGQAANAATRALLTERLRDVNAELTDAVSTAVLAGRLVRDVARPGTAQSPVALPTLVSGLAAGLLLGLGAALFRDRIEPLVLDADQVAQRTGLPVLTVLPAAVPGSPVDVSRLAGIVLDAAHGTPRLRSLALLHPTAAGARPVAGQLAEALVSLGCRSTLLRGTGEDLEGVDDRGEARAPLPTLVDTEDELRAAVTEAHRTSDVILAELPADDPAVAYPARLFDAVLLVVDFQRTRFGDLLPALARLQQDAPQRLALLGRQTRTPAPLGRLTSLSVNG